MGCSSSKEAEEAAERQRRSTQYSHSFSHGRANGLSARSKTRQSSEPELAQRSHSAVPSDAGGHGGTGRWSAMRCTRRPPPPHPHHHDLHTECEAHREVHRSSSEAEQMKLHETAIQQSAIENQSCFECSNKSAAINLRMVSHLNVVTFR